MSEAQRTRTYSWSPQDDMRKAAAGMTGLEVMRMMSNGELPAAPIGATMAMTPVSVEPGVVAFGLMPQEFHYNPLGTMHGGVYATLLDSALGCCVHTRLAKGQGYTTLTLEIKYLRAATIATGRLIATGRVVSLGRTTATAEADLRDERGKLYATATTTCMIFPAPRQDAAA